MLSANLCKGPFVILARHRLRHIQQLEVHENIFTSRFDRECSVARCDAQCCRGGVFVDLEEKERILAHAGMIGKHMEPHQTKDTTLWFEDRLLEDSDFPSGHAVGTTVRDYGCVFLQSDGRCVLQVAASREGMDDHLLKPFYCFAYPITVDHGVLMLDQPDFARRTECCTATPSGQRTVLDVCRDELEYVLGSEGYRALEEVAAMRGDGQEERQA